MQVWKIIFLSKCVICRFHVNLPGCMEVDGSDFRPMIFPGTQAWWIFQVNPPLINFPGRAGAVRGLCRSGRGGYFLGRANGTKNAEEMQC